MPEQRKPTIVLVVEDDPGVLETTLAMIEDGGLETIHATSSDEAVDILTSRNDISIVLTDVEIPGTFSGFELAATIRENWPATHVVVTSGVTPPDGRELPKGIPFLPKPYRQNTLLESLRERAG